MSTPTPPQGAEIAASPKKRGLSATIARNSFWLLIDNVGSMVTSFTCSILVARALGPDRMGEYNYLLWFATFLKMFAEVAIPATFRKFAGELMGRNELGTLKTLARAAMRTQLKLAIGGVIVGLSIVYLFFRPEQKLLATLAVLTIVPSLLVGIPAGVLFATENLRYNVMGSVTAMSVNLVGVTTSVVLKLGLPGVVMSLLLSRVADCTLRFALYHRYAKLPGDPRAPLDPALRKRFMRFASLQVLTTILYSLLFDRMEVFFLKGMAATREIAFFSISFTLVQYLLVVPSTLAGSANVSMTVQQGRDPRDAARIGASATWLTILFGAPVLFGVAALSDPLLRLMYGMKYLPAIPVLTVLALFGLTLAASAPTQFLLVAADRQVFYLTWLIVSGLVDVAGNFVLVPRYGAIGAAYAKGIAQTVGAVGFLIFLVRHFKVSLPWWRIFRLIVVCTIMFLGVKYIVRDLPPLPRLLIGIPLGAFIFGVLLRWLRCLDAVDHDRLRHLDHLLPGRIQRPYRALIGYLVPARTRLAPAP